MQWKYINKLCITPNVYPHEIYTINKNEIPWREGTYYYESNAN